MPELSDLSLSEFANPQTDLNNLALFGNGSIKFEGGQITVDRHLLVSAPAGNLSTFPGYGTQLHAGQSVWLSGHQIDLQDVSITAGEPGRWGLVNVIGVTVKDVSQPSSIQLDGAYLKGQQLRLAAGSISLNESLLEAPKGWIQVVANDASYPNKSLKISGSILDVSANNIKDLNAPALRSDSLQTDKLGEQSERISYPRIGLLSKGDIRLSENTILNASLDISSFENNPLTFTKLNMNSIADRSGLVLLIAEGAISLDSSSIYADAVTIRLVVFLLKPMA